MSVTLDNHTFRQIERALRAASSVNPAMPIPFNTAQYLASSAAYAEDLIRAERHHAAQQATAAMVHAVRVDTGADAELAGANKLI